LSVVDILFLYIQNDVHVQGKLFGHSKARLSCSSFFIDPMDKGRIIHCNYYRFNELLLGSFFVHIIR